MTENLPILIAAVFAFLLVALIVALIFSKQFRDAMLGGEGEASVLGVLTVKGVAIVLLCALFVGGLIYPLYSQSPTLPSAGNELDNNQSRCPETDCIQEISSILSPLEAYTSDTDPKNIVALTNNESENKKAKIAKCEAELKQKDATISQSAQELDLVRVKLKTANKASDEARNDSDVCQADLQKKDILIAEYKKGEKGLLSKLDRINSDIQEFYPAVDFTWEIDKKEEAAYRILEVLRTFGYYSTAPTKNPGLAREAIIRFQKAKHILPDDESKQGLLGRSTFVKLIEEYMAYENTVANKGLQGTLRYAARP